MLKQLIKVVMFSVVRELTKNVTRQALKEPGKRKSFYKGK